MVLEYHKFAATADGYRGKRAVVEQRVIEGLTRPEFDGTVLTLTVDSEQTQYLDENNTADGYYITLPDATTLWNNWQVAIVNDSKVSVPIYYYPGEDSTNLNLVRDLGAGNMVTMILVDNSTPEGQWTTLRTIDTIDAEAVEKYTSDVYETVEIPFNVINSTGTNQVTVDLCSVPMGMAVKSVYIKVEEKFVGNTTLTVDIGTDYNNTYFFNDIDLTGDVTDSNFSKNVYDDILSNSVDTQIRAYISGSNLATLTAGKVKIIVERAKLIDPTILKNAIVQMNMPIGSIISYMFNDVPNGYFRLDGSTLNNANQVAPQFVEKLNQVNNELVGEKLIVTRTQYENQLRDYGSCGKFAWYGANLRFPAINCFIRGLSDLTQLGRFQDDTMRRISGRWGGINGWVCDWWRQGGPTNPFTFTQTGWKAQGPKSGSSDAYYIVSFDTNTLGSNYAGSKTQPKHIKYPYLIAVFNKIQWESSLDYNKLLEASVNKAEKDLSNVSDVTSNFRLNSIGWMMPNFNNVQSRNWGQSYTESEPGFLFIQMWARFTSRGTVTIGRLSFEMGGNDSDDGGGSDTLFIPIPANTTYSTSGYTGTIRFIPCLR